MERQPYIAYVDILKILATLAVIMLHLSSPGFLSLSGTGNWYASLIYDGLTRWAVPVFVMVSGALFLDPKKSVTIHSVLHKSVPRLLRAYLFWWGAYVIVSYTMGVRGLSLFQPFHHLWYLPMLICIYLLTPVLRLVSERVDVMKYVLFVWIAYITISFTSIAINEISGHYLVQVWELFQSDYIISYMGYFLLGYYLSTITFNKKQKRIIGGLGLIGGGHFIGRRVIPLTL